MRKRMISAFLTSAAVSCLLAGSVCGAAMAGDIQPAAPRREAVNSEAAADTEAAQDEARKEQNIRKQ